VINSPSTKLQFLLMRWQARWGPTERLASRVLTSMAMGALPIRMDGPDELGEYVPWRTLEIDEGEPLNAWGIPVI